jgi:hypothetical protein
MSLLLDENNMTSIMIIFIYLFAIREQFLSAESSVEDFQMVSLIIHVLKTPATKGKEVVFEDFSALTICRRWGQFLQLC